MKILVAEDDAVSRHLLRKMLTGWGYDVEPVADGSQAWEALRRPGAPSLAILDWMMPGMDGPDICRKAREAEETRGAYLILVTARGAREDLIAGLEAGADDYVTKPFDNAELQARVQVGTRVVELRKSVADRVRELEAALEHVKQLQGILPICCYCKKVRTDETFWQRVEDYISEHAGVDFSHGICPECWDSVVRPEMEEMWGHSIPYEE
jgi:phosphoserine phosphatase RsbU/P